MNIARNEPSIVTRPSPTPPPPRNILLLGDALTLLRSLPSDSIQCCITSPPYFGLRDYGTIPQVWGGDWSCQHKWGERVRASWTTALPGPNGRNKNVAAPRERSKTAGNYCVRCGAWRGELGSEAALDDYLAHLVAIFEEVRRVLRPDGTCWLNIGDSYAGSWGNYAPGGITRSQRPKTEAGHRWERKAYADATAFPATARPQRGLKPKDLMLVPFRLALALQAAGWWVRSDIIWQKSNHLPESVKDRPTRSHEYVFLLAKSKRYFYNADAIREPHTSLGRPPGNTSRLYFDRDLHHQNAHKRRPEAARSFHPLGRNKRDVWTIPTQGFNGSHFATFPEKLVTPMILAGSRPGDIVLDPFVGSGTTAAVAKALGRNYLGIELNPAYVKLAEARIAQACPATGANNEDK